MMGIKMHHFLLGLGVLLHHPSSTTAGEDVLHRTSNRLRRQPRATTSGLFNGSSLSSKNSNSNGLFNFNSSKQQTSSSATITSVELCFDSPDYGKQTLRIEEEGGCSLSFVNDLHITENGPCPSSLPVGEEEVELKRRGEVAMVTYCKHFDSNQQVEIAAPKFFGDYLQNEKGAVKAKIQTSRRIASLFSQTKPK